MLEAQKGVSRNVPCGKIKLTFSCQGGEYGILDFDLVMLPVVICKMI